MLAHHGELLYFTFRQRLKGQAPHQLLAPHGHGKSVFIANLECQGLDSRYHRI